MIIEPDAAIDRRIIVLAPAPRDAEVAVALLSEAGVPAWACSTFDVAIAEARRGAAAFLLPEEALSADGRSQLAGLIEAQPPWSDLPLLVLTHAGADSVASREAAATLGNVTLLERPIRVGTLISAVRTALRARERQYQIREHLDERARVEAALREREERQAFLLTLSDALRPITKPAAVQSVAMSELCEHVGASHAQYWEADPQDDHLLAAGVHARAVLAAGRTLAVADAEADPRVSPADRARYHASGVRAWVGVPLVKAGRLAALVSVSFARAHEWTPAEIAIVEDTAQRTWAEMARARAEAALAEAETRFRAELEGRVRERTAALGRANASLQAEVGERRAAEHQVQVLFQRLVSVQEDERRRIARDLHDQLGQQMTALRMRLEVIRLWLKGDPAREEHATRTQQLAEELDRNIDFLTWELRPAVLERLGLCAALRHLVSGWSERVGIAASFKAIRAGDLQLRKDAEANLYRLVQEALHNIVKHARARRIDVRLERRAHEVVLAVRDDGHGFDASLVAQVPGAGLGLTSMRERAFLVGGSLEIDSSAGRGTTIIVKLPTASARRAAVGPSSAAAT